MTQAIAAIKFPQLLGALMNYMAETGESWNEVMKKISGAGGTEWMEERFSDYGWVKKGREWHVQTAE
jgi:hypothetical protein